MANVSMAIVRRITKHLNDGLQPTAVGNQVKLGDVVLIRANAVQTPAAEEVRRQAAERNIPVDISYWDRNRAVESQGNRRYAYDIAGNRHLISQKRSNQRVFTKKRRQVLQ